jgi:hypothetical protein
MKAADQYLRFVRWSDEDNLYVGYCPDLFPWGGVCHGSDEHATYRELGEIIAQEVSERSEFNSLTRGRPLTILGTLPTITTEQKALLCSAGEPAKAWSSNPSS